MRRAQERSIKPGGKRRAPGRRASQRVRMQTALAPLIFALALAIWLLPGLAGEAFAAAQPARLLPTNASCAQLAQADRTATNGALWGATILPGLGQPGGWFGPPICANGVNLVAPGGANVSCDRAPTNYAADGCAPGRATDDGFGWTFQCPEIVARFSDWAFGDAPGDWQGDAPFLWLSANHPSDFTAYADGGARAPVPGDILVWGGVDSQGRAWPASPAGGHVAVVSAVGGGQITFVEENMLVHRNGAAVNIPSETTSLSQSGDHWTVGHTFALNGGRTLYGWLHSSRNNGHFPGGVTTSPGALASAEPAASAPNPPAVSATTNPTNPTTQADAPSLARGVVVTSAGTLADLVWSDSRSTQPPSGATNGATNGAAQAVAESLGAPPGVALAPGQTPAIALLPDGERYIFARGQDGALYTAYTSPRQPGVYWQALGAPQGVTLQGSISALWDRTGVLVSALGSDGAVWLRAGPAGMLGAWTSLGRPSSAALQGAPLVFVAPPSPASSSSAVATATATATVKATATSAASATGTVMRLALALGDDGRLYEADWRPAAAMSGGVGMAPPPGWSGWQTVTPSGLAALPQGSLMAVSAASDHAALAQSGAAHPAYLLATDGAGGLWLLSRSAMGQQWMASALTAPTIAGKVDLATPLAATLTASQAPSLQVYVALTSAAHAGAASAAPNQAPSTQATTTAAPTTTSTPTTTLIAATTAAAATQPSAKTLVGSFAVDGASASSAGDWAPLSAADPTASAVALGLGTNASALLLAQGAALALQGPSAGLALLAPNASATTTTLTGSLAAPTSFSDAFTATTLDGRWLITGGASGAGRQAQVSAGALTLAAGVAALQGVPAGDFTVTAHVAPVGAWPTASGAQAGLMLRLDDWNSVSLALRADGSLALCATHAGVAAPCVTAPAPAGVNLKQGAYLRAIQASATLTAQVSADGAHWSQVGVLALPWLPTPGVFVGAYAPPLMPASATPSVTPDGSLPGFGAWAPYTSVGLFVAGGSGAATPVSAQFGAFAVGGA